MKYDQPLLQEKLAAEYVLGTLSGPARRRFVKLLEHDPNLRAAVAAWEARITPLAQGIKPVEPPPHVWERIAARTGIARAPVRQPRREKPSLLESLDFWRAFAGFAAAMAVALIVYVGTLQHPEPVPTIVTLAVLSDQAAKPIMVVSAEPKSHTLFITPVGRQEIATDRDYELWALPEGAAPKSLGVIHSGGITRIALPEAAVEAIRASKALAISVEPKGGSPTGRATGPVVYQGAVIKL